MRETLTISLPKRLRRDLEKMAKAEGVTSSEYVRRAIKADMFRRAPRATRRELVPKARVMGIYTDEDVFKIVSGGSSLTRTSFSRRLQPKVSARSWLMRRPAYPSSFGRIRSERNLNQFLRGSTILGQPRELLWPRMSIFVNLLNRNCS